MFQKSSKLNKFHDISYLISFNYLLSNKDKRILSNLQNSLYYAVNG